MLLRSNFITKCFNLSIVFWQSDTYLGLTFILLVMVYISKGIRKRLVMGIFSTVYSIDLILFIHVTLFRGYSKYSYILLIQHFQTNSKLRSIRNNSVNSENYSLLSHLNCYYTILNNSSIKLKIKNKQF